MNPQDISTNDIVKELRAPIHKMPITIIQDVLMPISQCQLDIKCSKLIFRKVMIRVLLVSELIRCEY